MDLLVESHHPTGITALDKIPELRLLGWAPKHGIILQSKNFWWFNRAPIVDAREDR